MSLRIVEDTLPDILYISITRACKVFMMDLNNVILLQQFIKWWIFVSIYDF